MGPQRPRTFNSLSKRLDDKVLSLVRRFVEEKTAEGAGKKDGGGVRLSVSELYLYISADGGVPRQKKNTIEKSIERAIEVLKEEASDDEEGIDMDSDFEGLDERNLMEVKETNIANKRIVDMWKMPSTPQSPAAQTPTTEKSQTNGGLAPPIDLTTPAETTPAVAPSPRKRKEKPTSREGVAKRQKGESRDPPTNICLADLGGVEDVIGDILELIGMPLTHPEVYTHTGVQPPRGVLLHGPPGCGKTMLANAIAGELGLPFIAVSAPSIVAGMSGESEKKLREIFEEAKEKAPCLVFLDEIDAITPKRESAQREMERRIVAQMLTCMDELTLEKTGGRPVLVIGATNRPDSLDPALRRAGRFDREICLNVPDEVGREKILKVLSKRLRLSGDFDFKTLAKMTPGFVGADLNALTAQAGVAAIKRIFEALRKGELPRAMITALTNGEGEAMDIDKEIVETAIAETSSMNPHNIISTFLKAYPDTLTPEQLEPLSITLEDFHAALPKIQPSSKREGFATVPDVTWADIGALHPIRTELQMAIVQPIKHPELFSSVGISAPAGVLLWGPPGCGKTLLAKAVANESRANFISVRGPELLNKYVGESERAVRQVFSRARASVPCVIFFDELDALVPRRDEALSESSSRVVNTLLTELDGLNARNGIFVVAATNRPDVIDPAMLRPGRLDKPLLVDLPQPEEKLEILKTLVKKTPISPDVELEKISSDPRTDGFSGADLAAVVREAAVGALKRVVFTGISKGVEAMGKGERKVIVEAGDFENALKNVRASVGKEDRETYRRLGRKFGHAGSGSK